MFDVSLSSNNAKGTFLLQGYHTWLDKLRNTTLAAVGTLVKAAKLFQVYNDLWVIFRGPNTTYVIVMSSSMCTYAEECPVSPGFSSTNILGFFSISWIFHFHF